LFHRKYGREYQLENLIMEVFKIMIILSTGTSRATGFGHLILETIRKD